MTVCGRNGPNGSLGGPCGHCNADWWPAGRGESTLVGRRGRWAPGIAVLMLARAGCRVCTQFAARTPRCALETSGKVCVCARRAAVPRQLTVGRRRASTKLGMLFCALFELPGSMPDRIAFVMDDRLVAEKIRSLLTRVEKGGFTVTGIPYWRDLIRFGLATRTDAEVSSVVGGSARVLVVDQCDGPYYYACTRVADVFRGKLSGGDVFLANGMRIKIQTNV